ncbi:hypothetical protein Zmor_008195 [Zophobas morio]|uniref:Uncharacterized protein n=1 Tax=Zophobas morio TaxID=2755281 RepID=A0AA38IU72_9CUCU|nr:hypothetical protein Zmor_008195 [Zophobas morio]
MAASDCFVCATRSRFSPYDFCSPIRFFCQHSKNSVVSKATIKLSKFGLVVSSTGLLCSLFPIVTILLLLPNLCVDEKSTCFVLIGDFVFLLGGFTLGFVTITGCQLICREAQGLSTLIENRLFYGIDSIINEKKTRNFILRRTWGTVSLHVWIVLPIVYLSTHSYDNLQWNATRKIAMVISVVFQCYNTVNFYTKVIIIGCILQAVKTNMSKVDSYPRYVRFVVALNSNLKLVTVIFIVMNFTWIMSTIVFLICNITAIFYHEDFNLFSVMILQTKSLGAAISLIMLYYIHDINLKEKVSNLTDAWQFLYLISSALHSRSSVFVPISTHRIYRIDY